jgi:hypothetical protein
MSFISMVTELRGSVPKLPIAFAPTLINRAWGTIRRANLWSFNLFESSWITPPLINTGTVTATQGLATIIFDAAAITAINAAQIAQPYSLITQRQFRIGVGGIYSLIAYNTGTGAATLDRIFGDPGGAGQAYNVYQLYYAAPFPDFRTWLSVRNPQMFIDLDLTTTRAEVDAMDPQRTWYQFPTRVVPYAIDNRGAGTSTPSATIGFPLFELWGQPIQLFTYQCYGIRNGADLVAPSDTLPFAVREETVIARAKDYAYEWAEANKDMSPRSTGPDFKYLRGATMAEYKELLQKDRQVDKDFVDNWLTSRMPGLAGNGIGFYNTLAGFAGPYSQL